MTWVGRSGVVELPQIATVFWGDSAGARVAASRRVRLLTDHGLLETGVVALHEPNRVTLTPKGAEHLPEAERAGLVLRTRIRGTTVAADHLLATSRVWAALARRLATTPPLRLLRFFTEGEIRRALGRADGALIPDAVVNVGTDAALLLGLAIEVDLVTEVARQVFARKAERYAEYLPRRRPLYGLHLDALVVVAPGLPRLRRLAEVVSAAGAEQATFFQDLGRLGPTTVLDELATAETLRRADGATSPFTVSLF